MRKNLFATLIFIAAVLYHLSPIDLVSDGIPVAGQFDDLALYVLYYVISRRRSDKKK